MVNRQFMVDRGLHIYSILLEKKFDSAMGKRKKCEFGFTKSRPNSDPVVTGSF